MPENAPAHPPVFDTGCYVGTTVAADIYSESGAHLATVHPHPQQMSRARLYAAAPDLLAALQQLRRLFNPYYPTDKQAAAIAAADAAIAKATGK